MKNLSASARTYILGTILVGIALTAWSLTQVDWTNPGLLLLIALGAVAQTFKVEGPNAKTNYSIAWFVYGLTFFAYGTTATILVVVVAHLVEWVWHKYPWFIQSFNIGNHVFAVYLAGLAFRLLHSGGSPLTFSGTFGLVLANLIFVFTNHFLVGWVIKLARGQSFAESGVFEVVTLSLDLANLSLGTATAIAWAYNPFAALVTALPLLLLYQALRLPALMRRVK